MLRTAVLRGIRPTSLIKRKQPFSKWAEDDFILVDAYQISEDEATATGIPLWVARTENPNIGFMVEERTDRGQAALDEWDKAHAEDKDKSPGLSRFVVAVDVITHEPIEMSGAMREKFFSASEDEEAQGIVIDDPNGDSTVIPRRPKGGYNASDYGE